MHPHICKSNDNQCITIQKIIKFVILAYYFRTIRVFTLNRFKMPTFWKRHNTGNAFLDFKFKFICHTFSKFIY